MKSHFKKLLPILVAGLIPLFSNAQKTSTIPEWERKIHKVLANDKAHAVIKDSIALYTFNLKLNIVRNKAGKSKVNRIVASDDLLYQIYPNYKDLKAINYQLLLNNRKQVTLIIPVIIYNTSPTATSQHTKDGDVALISLENAANILNKFFY